MGVLKFVADICAELVHVVWTSQHYRNTSVHIRSMTKCKLRYPDMLECYSFICEIVHINSCAVVGIIC